MGSNLPETDLGLTRAGRIHGSHDSLRRDSKFSDSAEAPPNRMRRLDIRLRIWETRSPAASPEGSAYTVPAPLIERLCYGL